MEESNVLKINQVYDSHMFSGDNINPAVRYMVRHMDTIGFYNNGYWKGTEESLGQAQINLIETLVSFFVNKHGNVLDVACGKGASTKFLAKYFDPKKITGINISEKQLELCRLVAPDCDFRLMDATSLAFADASIDNVLCIEAAFHFQTRERFLREACRVLRPGGRLAMSDVLLDPKFGDRFGWQSLFPRENYLASPDDLRDILLGAGFAYVRVEDSSEQSHKPLRRYLSERLERDVRIEPELAARTLQEIKQQFDDHIASCMIYASR